MSQRTPRLGVSLAARRASESPRPEICMQPPSPRSGTKPWVALLSQASLPSKQRARILDFPQLKMRRKWRAGGDVFGDSRGGKILPAPSLQSLSPPRASVAEVAISKIPMLPTKRLPLRAFRLELNAQHTR